jgi:UDP-N-acetylmuramoyl-tripeptide--D-alanyl-D-alanine ligase
VVPGDAKVLEPFLGRDDIDVHRFDPSGVRRQGEGWAFDVGGESVELDLPFTQRHMAENTLAALVAYVALGLPLERAREGAAKIELSRWRGEVLALPGGGFVINDAYNANPTSMRAALVDLSERASGRRRVAILGEMAELGDYAETYHLEIGELVQATADLLVAIGPQARAYLRPGIPDMVWLPDATNALELVRPGDAVLVKASRAVGLEGVPTRLANLAREWVTESSV